ncbi:hypothetical protein DFJ74DRAFT_396933 [Hyaloraphidium curvatum]|nr:hypothetical protein DFJ74DRAFT_396933 [Hyaloraphidium curvatum]
MMASAWSRDRFGAASSFPAPLPFPPADDEACEEKLADLAGCVRMMGIRAVRRCCSCSRRERSFSAGAGSGRGPVAAGAGGLPDLEAEEEDAGAEEEEEGGAEDAAEGPDGAEEEDAGAEEEVSGACVPAAAPVAGFFFFFFFRFAAAARPGTEPLATASRVSGAHCAPGCRDVGGCSSWKLVGAGRTRADAVPHNAPYPRGNSDLPFLPPH